MNKSQLINQTSGNTEWYTPWNIIERAKLLMGGIDLDPFSCPAANRRPEGTIADKIFTVEDDSLNRPWYGNVWMNHPWGKEYNADAIGKLTFEYTRRNRTLRQALCITFASTSEKWFAPLLHFPQFYFTGRINYLRPGTLEPVSGVTKGSVLTFLPPGGMNYNVAVAKLHATFGSVFAGVAK